MEMHACYPRSWRALKRTSIQSSDRRRKVWLVDRIDRVNFDRKVKIREKYVAFFLLLFFFFFLSVCHRDAKRYTRSTANDRVAVLKGTRDYRKISKEPPRFVHSVFYILRKIVGNVGTWNREFSLLMVS